MFVANTVNAQDLPWLKEIKNNWGASGVCVRLRWKDLEPNKNNFEFTLLKNTFKKIYYDSRLNLDIYLRIQLGQGKPDWVTIGRNFSKNDFQIKHNDSLYDHSIAEGDTSIPLEDKFPLNFTSNNSTKRMTIVLKRVLDSINVWNTTAGPLFGVKNKIKEIVPTFSPSDEQEYPNKEMCGYSSNETNAFINLLVNKYGDLDHLNQKWRSDFKSFYDIDAKDFNWDEFLDTLYIFPNGRVDWINFRTEQLTQFINSLATICLTKGFKMGAQIGSLYDGGIEKRGWVDPTKLFEKVNSIHTADIYNYEKNFDFAADYVRSICKFWNNTNSNTNCSFTTETNWPGYDKKTAAVLCPLWTEQLKHYYNKGASALYLVGWDIPTATLEQYRVNDNSDHDYSSWCDTIKSYSGGLVVTTNSNLPYFVHLDCEQVFFNHNSPQKITENGLTFYKFELYNSLLAKDNYNTTTTVNYDGNKDIITNYMLLRNPNYINRYRK